MYNACEPVSLMTEKLLGLAEALLLVLFAVQDTKTGTKFATAF